jgi:hypothetical protein
LRKEHIFWNFNGKEYLAQFILERTEGSSTKANKIRFYEEKNGADTDVSVFYLYKIAKAWIYFGATNLTRMKKSWT